MIGKTAFEVVQELVKTNQDVQRLHFCYYLPKKHFNQRNKNFSTMFQHDNETGTHFSLERQTIMKMGGGDLLKMRKDSNLAVGVFSKVSTTGDEEKHFPLLDFDCEINTKNLEAISRFLQEVAQETGYLLESGNSYHFYSNHLLTLPELASFLGKCLLFPLTDHRYIGHALIRRSPTLRLTDSQRHKVIPTVVQVL